MKYYYKDFMTPLGEMRAVATEEAIVLLSFKDAKDYETALQKLTQRGRLVRVSISALIDQVIYELTAYLHGAYHSFTTPLQLDTGTPFQQSVWQALRELNMGQTVNYSDIAQKIGRPKSTRAVATAIGQNPISIIIPCHRVLRKDGSLGGFNSGLHRKIQLLEHEQRMTKDKPNF
ncbi:methylated-DNA--[protein]-cysteine S-methyltransferase [Staphylococcus agnetis]|uniref:methylated-DNA--[protein]-cysteine S-methyltransferase n=1 Tax=Staphylococcus agnetis TaxID=985762 RepID=UPI000CD07184|nr:methylated-DNA--[protein]-cysteine S-methyltransferase [Staphylococcus agnetis]MBY7664614.1 methylated-DNA--[protein]-cysteine S-methyltransferase [Staphylococcus agnetis]NJH68425.1 methylated-DNA--[protein]-cysteine S-methyltransferase [Staphylococcus agnetis]NJH78654.1 methylated-DNA--[protein]-cysteine S-methyltransferase [Staphylococcus agnetis]PNY86120.1 methylated-DNA--[protein]-cysteine S-methyltransferase [Staphylococcus agnetis]PTH68486.1 methylated-DNA--[protein]-cysteine S-methyl